MSNQANSRSLPPNIPQPVGTLNTKEMRRILASSFIGSMIEFYDFMLYSTAASIVFAKVFFTSLPQGVGVLVAFVTLAAGYFARPLGGLIFGHFGDRVGRKQALVISMLIMGAGTVLIGLMPPTSSIGLFAPLCLLLLRLLQGIAVGGEWGGAALMAIEHAPKGKRVFAAAFANAGGPSGAVLATLVLSLMTAITSPADFLAWGWRVPFLLSAVLIVVGLVIRLKVAETPAFKEMQQEGEKVRVPIAEVVRKHSTTVVIGMLAAISVFTTQAIVTVWGVSIAVEAGENTTAVLNWKAAAAVLTVVTTFVVARIADRVGRRRMLLVGTITTAVAAWPLVFLIGSGQLAQYAVAIMIGNGIVQGLVYGPVAAYVAELFPASIRYTGASVAYQFASALGAGLMPVIASSLVMIPGIGLSLVALVWSGVAVASTVAVFIWRRSTDGVYDAGRSPIRRRGAEEYPAAETMEVG